jgi:hypothetical protein
MSVDECGLNSKRDHIFFPMWKYDKDKDKFKMVRRRFKLEIPSRIDMEFFAKIVSTIRTDRASGCDWSWIGLKRNILQPNRDHIKEVMGIDDFFVDRLFKYGETLFEYWDYDCTFSDDENGIPFSYKTFFTERELVCEEN